MGVYVYKLTAKVVKLQDGSAAQVAKFAYKPSWSDEAFNRKCAFRTGCTRNINVKADKFVLLETDGKSGDVFDNPGKASVFYDSEFGPVYAHLGKMNCK